MELSPEEYEAETIYRLVVLRHIDKDLFRYMAQHLESRSKTAAEYLKYMIFTKAKLEINLNSFI